MMRKRIGGVLAAALIVVGLTACWQRGEPEAEAPPSSVPASPSGSAASPEPTATPEGIVLEPVFGETRFEMPIGLEVRPNDSERVYIVEQAGRIVSANPQAPSEQAEVVLDITDRVHDRGGEQGLLGLAFHPLRPDTAFVNYTTATHTVIVKVEADPADPSKLDPDSEQVVLTFEQPYSNHNGGQLAFGPDGYLYIASGDGGSGGDPQDNGQSLQTLLGKILRIDVDRESDGSAYAIPADNPFIGEGLPEIYAYGLRNPWRFSFDEETGKLWAADVGQDRYEEINLIERGGNYGWRLKEGTECFNPRSGCEREGLKEPLFTYGHDDGISITGGYVYRGERLPHLVGWYVYADYGTGVIWAIREREDGTAEHQTLLRSDENITSFGQDSTGELYVCTQDGIIYRIG